ncbi:hypothetical protein K503DRAFT_862989 [Rhizopogon vinicolor AM-OR11-026]|uniref:Uncharacterized protein n=1 Tax=Rhizopogon vinicolor AM-OR11-026 TaxID=1314800 RepID=A0A1B7NCJ0_9AGAM|nr:hypothetical protein K503DRAFT_862989 [Rhizopogon vinicolor AM-OR11-026]
MSQNRATSPTSPSVLERPPSRSAANHLPPRPSCGLIKKLTSRVEGNVVCKKRKRSTERREQKVPNDGDRMCLAQRLRHDDDAATDRHARYDLWRASSHRKEQYSSDSPPPDNHKGTDEHSPHSAKSRDRHISDDNSKEKTISSPSLNSSASGGSGSAGRDATHPALQGINTVSSAESVDRFLDTIDLSSATLCNALAKGKPVSPTQQVLPPTPVSIAPVPLPLTGFPAVNVRPVPFTFGPEQLSLLHHGYPLNYDLTLLPNDPMGPITLLGATQSEPGAYLVVGAHYRRTGRSRAACEVIKALVGRHAPTTRVGEFIGENEENGEASFQQTSTSPMESPAALALSPIDINTPSHKAAVLRPAFLLLAACQLDISRDCSSPEEKIAHANAAQELFRTVYEPKDTPSEKTNINALGLAFTDRAGVPPAVDNNVPTSVPKQTPGIPTAPAASRILALEEELRMTRTAKSALEADLADAKKRQERTAQSIKEAENRSRYALRLLETERDEVRALKRRLVETEQKMSDMEQSDAGAETRMWGRLRDMIYDQFVGGRGY